MESALEVARNGLCVLLGKPPQESIANFKETVLQAEEEVEDASTQFLGAQERLKLLATSADAAKRASGLALEQYQLGTLTYPGVVEALQYLVQQQDRAIGTRGEVALNLVALYKALGGGWQLSRDKTLLPEDVRTQMKKRTDWWSFTGKWEMYPKEFKAPQ
jgi:hypothetical protein